jgi:hypothetical protein
MHDFSHLGLKVSITGLVPSRLIAGLLVPRMPVTLDNNAARKLKSLPDGDADEKIDAVITNLHLRAYANPLQRDRIRRHPPYDLEARQRRPDR